MICEICGKDGATIRIRQIIGLETREMRLCEDCAREKGILCAHGGLDDNAAWYLEGLFEESGGVLPAPRACSSCGTLLRDIKTSRRAGCPACYEYFAREIRRLLKIREGGGHRGKLPLRLLSYKTFYIDRENLKIQLEAALETEEYEKAAELRDKIQLLEAQAVEKPHG